VQDPRSTANVPADVPTVHPAPPQSTQPRVPRRSRLPTPWWLFALAYALFAVACWHWWE
jgi:hypothetical protein